MKKALIVVSCVLIVAAAGVYFGIDFLGDIAIKSIVGSVDEQQIENMLNSATQKEEAKPEKQTKPSENSLNPKSTQKPNVSAKVDKIEYNDKVQAINFIKSKFSASEISYYQKKLDEGVTPELIAEVKEKLKARCTVAEIEQIKEWYYKYK